MLVLFETPAGFALFKVLNQGKLKEANIKESFTTPEGAQKFVELKAFSKFENAQEAVAAASALIESEMSKSLKKFLKKEIVKKKIEELAVSDKTLGSIIKEKLSIPFIYNDAVVELMRGIRNQFNTLLGGVTSEKDFQNMALGLSHSLSRYKLKFSPDKVDTMIVQAISLLDDLDKELNIYAMRVKEWYGWHFPELTKIIPDNNLYAKTALKLQNRNNAQNVDLTDILPEELASEVKDAAVISMGTEISDGDLLHICKLCEEVISIGEYRSQLFDYLKNRMQAIAPNLTHLVGELVGARLIAKAGSLLNLAKHPASTVQILGAEKALFRALKAKTSKTPKYGLLYHASLVGQAPAKHKGKIARVVAAKCAISSRVDALGEKEHATIGIESREKVEQRIQLLDGVSTRSMGGKARGQLQQKKANRTQNNPALLKQTTNQYNTAADVTKEKKGESTKSSMEVEEEDDDSDKHSDSEEEKEKPKSNDKKENASDDEEDEDEEKPKKKKEKKKEKKEKKEKKKEKKEKKDKKEKKEKKKKGEKRKRDNEDGETTKTEKKKQKKE